MANLKTPLLTLGAMALGSNLMIAAPAWAGDIVLAVEEPTAGTTYTGVANLRGWVVGSAGINRVELYVDGAFSTNIPVGGLRSDVGGAYPGYPNSSNSGFSMAFNYSNLSAGPHTVRIVAVDRDGVSRESSIAFTVTRFDNPYITDPAKISLNGATGTFDSRSISLKNMTADGKTYDIRLDWRTEVQGFVITQIVPAGTPPANDYSGTYRSKVSQTSNNCVFPVSQQTESELKLTQNGTQLSGTESNTVPVSGTVDSQGSFSLTSGRLVQNPSANCRAESYFKYQGNFPGQTVAITIQYEYAGSCPYYNCAASFQGSITRTSATTRADDPGQTAASAMAADAIPLIDLARESQ